MQAMVYHLMKHHLSCSEMWSFSSLFYQQLLGKQCTKSCKNNFFGEVISLLKMDKITSQSDGSKQNFVHGDVSGLCVVAHHTLFVLSWTPLFKEMSFELVCSRTQQSGYPMMGRSCHRDELSLCPVAHHSLVVLYWLVCGSTPHSVCPILDSFVQGDELWACV
jgi:hypothetical protein